jgi:hypothetical protein
MRNCNVQYMFLERRCNMRGEYESKVGGMSMGWVVSTTTKWCFL